MVNKPIPKTRALQASRTQRAHVPGSGSDTVPDDHCCRCGRRGPFGCLILRTPMRSTASRGAARAPPHGSGRSAISSESGQCDTTCTWPRAVVRDGESFADTGLVAGGVAACLDDTLANVEDNARYPS